MAQMSLDAMLVDAGAEVSPQSAPARVQLQHPFRRVHLALLTKGDYAVANIIRYFRTDATMGKLGTRGYFVPPWDGPTYMRYDNGDTPDSEFYELQQFYALGCFQRLPDCALSQRYPHTNFDRLQAAGYTLAGCAAVLFLCTSKNAEAQLTATVKRAAADLRIPTFTLTFPAASRKQPKAGTVRQQRREVLTALQAFVDGLGAHSGSLMVVNQLSGTHPGHLRHLSYVLPFLAGMTQSAAEGLVAREGGEQTVLDQVACEYTRVPTGTQARKGTLGDPVM